MSLKESYRFWFGNDGSDAKFFNNVNYDISNLYYVTPSLICASLSEGDCVVVSTRNSRDLFRSILQFELRTSSTLTPAKVAEKFAEVSLAVECLETFSQLADGVELRIFEFDWLKLKDQMRLENFFKDLFCVASFALKFDSVNHGVSTRFRSLHSLLRGLIWRLKSRSLRSFVDFMKRSRFARSVWYKKVSRNDAQEVDYWVDIFDLDLIRLEKRRLSIVRAIA